MNAFDWKRIKVSSTNIVSEINVYFLFSYYMQFLIKMFQYKLLLSNCYMHKNFSIKYYFQNIALLENIVRII